MKSSFFKTEGSLRIVLGRGYISAYELGILKNGDIVEVTDRACGEYAGLYYNCQLIGQGDIVLLHSSERIGFRIADTGWHPSSVPFPGVSKEVVEILETEFVVGIRRCSFGELKGIQKNSVIDFGHHSGNTRNIELYAGGVKAATGICVVRGERWGIKIDESFVIPLPDIDVRTTQSCPSEERVKYYDFTRPDRFSREQIFNIAGIHDRLCRNINLTEGGSRCKVGLVDQLTWGEFCDNTKKHGVKLLKSVIAGSFREKQRVKPQNDYVAYLPSSDFADDGSVAVLSEYFRTQKERVENAFPMGSVYIDFQGKEAAKFIVDETKTVSFLTQLESCWRERLLAEFTKKEEHDRLPTDFIDEHEMIILVHIDIGDNTASSEHNCIHLVYPYIYLQKVLHLLA